MIELNTSSRARDAYRAAHAERGKMISAAWNWIFSGK